MNNIIKLVIIVVWFIVWFWSVLADDILDSYIKKNFEYIEVSDDSVYAETIYKSNKWNEYYFIWTNFLVFTDISQLDWMIKQWTISKYDTLFIIRQWESYLWISKSDKKRLPDDCYELDINQNWLFENYEDLIIIKNWDKKILWKWWFANWCFYYKENLYIPKSEMAIYDSLFLEKNSNDMYWVINKIWVSDSFSLTDRLKMIYDFIIINTDYDFDALGVFNPNIFPDDTTPWRVSSFFEWKKVVCDWYSKTFDFIVKIFNISTKRILWKLQPIEKSSLVVKWALHSWNQVWDMYFDATFDDSDGKLSHDYFNKSKICFNVDHYTTGFVLFDTIEQRYDFVKNYGDILINECPEILNHELITDQKVFDFIKYSFGNYRFKDVYSLICRWFWICNESLTTKQELYDYIKWFTLTMTDMSWSREYKVDEELAWLVIDESSKSIWLKVDYYKNIENIEKPISKVNDIVKFSEPLNKLPTIKLSNNDRKKVNKLYKHISATIWWYSSKKRIVTINKINDKIELLLESGKLSNSLRNQLLYLQRLFVVEK